jgi:hypothetical protein
VDFVVCTLAAKKRIRAGFDMSDWTIPLSDRRWLPCGIVDGSFLCIACGYQMHYVTGEEALWLLSVLANK